MRNTKRRRTDVADGKTMTTLRIRKRLCNEFHSVLSLDSKGQLIYLLRMPEKYGKWTLQTIILCFSDQDGHIGMHSRVPISKCKHWWLGCIFR